MDVESPLKGWPLTKPLKDQAGFRVAARYVTPERVMFTETVGILIYLGGITLVGWLFYTLRLTTWPEFFTVGGAVIVVGWISWATRLYWGRLFFGKTTIIEFTPQQIKIKGFWGFKNYDRTLPHEFNFEIHDKAEKEEETEIERRRDAAQKGKELKIEKYFRRSFHIVLRYAGQRVEVASVFGKKEAEALLVRLQLLDQLMDAARGEHGAPVLSEPDVQYGERPEAG